MGGDAKPTAEQSTYGSWLTIHPLYGWTSGARSYIVGLFTTKSISLNHGKPVYGAHTLLAYPKPIVMWELKTGYATNIFVSIVTNRIIIVWKLSQLDAYYGLFARQKDGSSGLILYPPWLSLCSHSDEKNIFHCFSELKFHSFIA